MDNEPIPISGDPAAARPRLRIPTVAIDDVVLERLRGACALVSVEAPDLTDAGRDWWPLAMIWATQGAVPARPAAVVRPSSHGEVAEVLAICNEARIPVTAAGGRSGVCGAAVPIAGGVALDTRELSGIRDVDVTSLVVDVGAGTIGAEVETVLRSDWTLTVGHRPQSVAISTVGGWLACRSAGQYSTRYGKIEDIVVGLDVVTADGRTIHTGGQPRQATGPDLTGLFVGSEGTLGVITGARLRAHRAPSAERRVAFGFASFAEGLGACRRILQRGATPAVLRLYDALEGNGNFGTGDLHPLLVLDEGDPVVVDATIDVVTTECADATALDEGVVGHWVEHRDDVSGLAELISTGFVVDTMEVAGPWSTLERIHRDVTSAISAVDATLIVSTHQSHAYTDGACLYFTFVGQPGADSKDDYYRTVWDAGSLATLTAGGALSHHHGIGLNRARFMDDALGDAMSVLGALKNSLDPNGILNPGKLGFVNPFGGRGWPTEVDEA